MIPCQHQSDVLAQRLAEANEEIATLQAELMYARIASASSSQSGPIPSKNSGKGESEGGEGLVTAADIAVVERAPADDLKTSLTSAGGETVLSSGTSPSEGAGNEKLALLSDNGKTFQGDDSGSALETSSQSGVGQGEREGEVDAEGEGEARASQVDPKGVPVALMFSLMWANDDEHPACMESSCQQSFGIFSRYPEHVNRCH